MTSRDKLIRENQALVWYLASKYRFHPNFHDIVQAGMVGLVKAIDRFDPEKGKLSVYASFAIKEGFDNYIKSTESLVHTFCAVRLFKKMNKVVATFVKTSGGIEPTDMELAHLLDVSLEKVRELRIMNYCQAQGMSEDGPMIEDIEQVETPEHDLTIQAELKEHMKLLPGREANVLIMRFGLFNTEPMSLVTIAEKIGISKERVRQIEATAIDHMRDRKLNHLKAFLTEC